MGVTTGNTLDIVRAVEENRLDLGLVTLPVQGRSLAVTEMLDEEFVTIYASRETEMPAVYTRLRLQLGGSINRRHLRLAAGIDGHELLI